MVGYLSGTLAEKLRSAGERLEEKDRDLTGLQEFHQFVLESIDSGLFTTDPEGRLTSFNRRAEEILGYSQAEVRGRLWWEVFAWSAPTGQSGILATGMSHRLEEVGRRKDGTRLILALSLAPLQARGRSAGIVGAFQDITPLKKMEEVVRRKQCDVNELVQDTIHLLEQTPEYGGKIRFVRHLAPDGVVTMVDPDQMRQVCWNLGLNACQAMPDGGTLAVATRRVAPPVGGTE